MPKRKKSTITLKHIAERVGISVRAASSALRENPDSEVRVSAKTRARTLAVAKQLNYLPNMVASSLARGKTDNIVLGISSDISLFNASYIMQLLTGMLAAFKKEGLRLLVFSYDSSDSDSELKEILKLINSRTVDGIALVEPKVYDSRIEYLTKTGIPLVLFRRYFKRADLPAVDTEDVEKMREVAQKMKTHNYQNVLCVENAPALRFAMRKERHRVFIDTLCSLNVKANTMLIEKNAELPVHLPKFLKKFKPQALFLFSDQRVKEADGILHRIGIKAGKDLACWALSAGLPPQTYAKGWVYVRFHRDFVLMGKRAGELLGALVSGRESPDGPVLIPTTIDYE